MNTGHAGIVVDSVVGEIKITGDEYLWYVPLDSVTAVYSEGRQGHYYVMRRDGQSATFDQYF